MINKELVKALGRKNFIEILIFLRVSPKSRYNSIKESLESGTSRQVSENLKIMIKHKLVIKKSYSTQHTQYNLTKKGIEVLEIIRRVK